MSAPSGLTATPAVIKTATGPLHEHGIQLISLLSAVIRIGRTYTVTNTVLRGQLESLEAALKAAQPASGEIVLVVLDTDLFLNGARIPVSTTNLRYHRTVIEALTRRDITGLCFLAGTSAEDLATFFGLFLSPSCPHGEALVQACAGAGLERVVPAIHATSSAGVLEAIIHEGAALPDLSESIAEPWSGQRHFTAAFDAAGPVFADLASGHIDLRRVRRVIYPLVEAAAAGRSVVVGLAEPHGASDYLRAHSVNVCAVAVSMGAVLGLDRKALADLGAAALLHDAGMTTVAAGIVRPLEAFTPEERSAAQRHPIEGARLIADSMPLNATSLVCIRAALEHHGGPGGYPEFPRDWSDSALSRIVSVADCFVNLQARACEMIQSATPYEALGMMFGPLAKQFHPALLWALVQAVGLYPPGQRVELSDGSIATVIAPQRDDPARPYVRVTIEADGRSGEPRTLAPIPSGMTVRRALPRAEDPESLAQAA